MPGRRSWVLPKPPILRTGQREATDRVDGYLHRTSLPDDGVAEVGPKRMRGLFVRIGTMMIVAALTVLAPDVASPWSLAFASLGNEGGEAIPDSPQNPRADTPVDFPVETLGLDGVITVTVTVNQRPAEPVRVAVYRFYSPRYGTHFFTPSAAERDMVMATWPDVWRYEGVAYSVNPAKNSQPLYRFWNRYNGGHFYTASAQERDSVFAKWPHVYQYDGETYAVSPGPAPGKLPVFRFFNVKNGSHFYTASAEERDTVLRRWGNIYRYEGTAFYLGQ